MNTVGLRRTLQPWLDTKLVTPCTWYWPLTAQCRGPPESPCGARSGVSRGCGGRRGCRGAARGAGPDLAAGAHAVAAGAHHGVLDDGAPVGRAGADLVVHDGQVGLEQDAGQLPVACAEPAPVSAGSEPPEPATARPKQSPRPPPGPSGPVRPPKARRGPTRRWAAACPEQRPERSLLGPPRAPRAPGVAQPRGNLGRGEPVTHCG